MSRKLVHQHAFSFSHLIRTCTYTKHIQSCFSQSPKSTLRMKEESEWLFLSTTKYGNGNGYPNVSILIAFQSQCHSCFVEGSFLPYSSFLFLIDLCFLLHLYFHPVNPISRGVDAESLVDGVADNRQDWKMSFRYLSSSP